MHPRVHPSGLACMKEPSDHIGLTRSSGLNIWCSILLHVQIMWRSKREELATTVPGSAAVCGVHKVLSGSMKNLARYASVKCWPLQAAKVDGDTSEQSQTANISEIIECREYHRGMQRSGNRMGDNDWKFMDCRQEPDNGGLEIYSPWFHDLCVFICVL